MLPIALVLTSSSTFYSLIFWDDHFKCKNNVVRINAYRNYYHVIVVTHLVFNKYLCIFTNHFEGVSSYVCVKTFKIRGQY